MADLCAYGPSKCVTPEDERFCSDICAMLGAKLIDRVRVSSDVTMKPDHEVVPRCVCGHVGCGDSLVSGHIS
jgi:hypothetical protein